MKIQFLGAARTVTGSMHLLSVNGNRILLDCGMFQGKRAESVERNRTFPFDPKTINAVVLSHAHIDHAGNLPNLVKQGFSGPIYATNATRDLCNIMLYDSAYIQERDIEFINKKHAKRKEPPVEALYSVIDVTDTMNQFIGINYNQPITIAKGVQVTLLDAGHILGSSVVVCDIDDNGKSKRITFTGDLGRKNAPILRDPEQVTQTDVLISESTYGGKFHAPIDGMKDALATVAKRTVERGGKIIVPSFSVERTQDIVYLLSELVHEGTLPEIPIYVDSPLAVDATDIFRIHPECFDKETIAHINANQDPFGFRRLTYVRTVDQSKALNNLHTPCMIIAASGMCEAGRIVHHLANNIENPNNTIMIVGYQADHTLGRRIVEKSPIVKIFGEELHLNAEVAVLNSFSAHADQTELSGYIEGIDPDKLKNVFLVHGELEQAEKLAAKLKEQKINNIDIPVPGQQVEC